MLQVTYEFQILLGDEMRSTLGGRFFFFRDDRGFAAHNRSFATGKNPLAPMVNAVRMKSILSCGSLN